MNTPYPLNTLSMNTAPPACCAWRSSSLSSRIDPAYILAYPLKTLPPQPGTTTTRMPPSGTAGPASMMIKRTRTRPHKVQAEGRGAMHARACISTTHATPPLWHTNGSASKHGLPPRTYLAVPPVQHVAQLHHVGVAADPQRPPLPVLRQHARHLQRRDRLLQVTVDVPDCAPTPGVCSLHRVVRRRCMRLSCPDVPDCAWSCRCTAATSHSGAHVRTALHNITCNTHSARF